MNNPVTLTILKKNNNGENNPNYGKRLSVFTKEKMRENMINRKDLSKKTLQIDITNNNIVNVYQSVAEAKRKTGVHNISAVCRGKIKTSGGYKWMYSLDNRCYKTYFEIFT
jgi:hypothetical protein